MGLLFDRHFSAIFTECIYILQLPLYKAIVIFVISGGSDFMHKGYTRGYAYIACMQSSVIADSF